MIVFDNYNQQVELARVESLQTAQAWDLTRKGKLGYCIIAWLDGQKYPAVLQVLGEDDRDRVIGEKWYLPRWEQMVETAKYMAEQLRIVDTRVMHMNEANRRVEEIKQEKPELGRLLETDISK